MNDGYNGPPIEVKIAGKPKGLGPISWREALVLILILVGPFACALLYHPAPNYNLPGSAATPAAGREFAGVLGSVALVALAVLVLGILAYAIARAVISLREAAARARAAEIQATLHQRDGNGHAPIVFDGRRWVDPDAAPAGLVEGLNGKTTPTMPGPATPAHETAANAARLIRLAHATGGIGPALAGLLGAQPAAGGQMPPVVQVEQVGADTGRLIEAARSDYRLLEAGDDA